MCHPVPHPATLLEVYVGPQSGRVARVAGRRGGKGRVVRRDHVCLELLPARPPERAAVAAAQDSRLLLGRDSIFNTFHLEVEFMNRVYLLYVRLAKIVS